MVLRRTDRHDVRDDGLRDAGGLVSHHVTVGIERLSHAVAAGWRDYYSVSNDPRWRTLRDDPRFKDLMADVKTDIDSERARLLKIEATDNFVARLDHSWSAVDPRQTEAKAGMG